MCDQQIPTLVAHRGYMDRYPENSWLGLKAALDAGARCLEFDIQMCADGGFVLMHDADLLRTAHIQRSVFEMDSNELTKISVHEPNRFGDKFHPLPISTLVQVLDSLAAYPAIDFMVEIKEESLDHWGLETVMKPLMEILNPFRSNAILISFSQDALGYAKGKGAMRLGLVLEKYDNKHKEIAFTLNPDFLICNHRKLPTNEHPWDGPWEWMLYEINSPGDALAWGAQGVRFIETSNIGSMLQSIKAYRHV